MKINVLLSERDIETIENMLLKERKAMFKDRTSNVYSEDELEKLLQINAIFVRMNYALAIEKKTNNMEVSYAKEN